MKTKNGEVLLIQYRRLGYAIIFFSDTVHFDSRVSA